MDEIETLLRAIIEETDHVANNRAELKRLIELVEKEQVTMCVEKLNNSRNRFSIHDSPMVSESIDWEEL